MSDDIEAQLADLEARFDALNRSRLDLRERVESLEDENDRLCECIAELEQVVDPDPNHTDYGQLGTDQKVYRVRRSLVETAGRTGGKAAMEYTDVIRLFNGYPSPGHAYKLMRRAADYDPETDTSHFEGIDYDKHSGENQRVLVNLDAVNDETLIHAANKALDGGAV